MDAWKYVLDVQCKSATVSRKVHVRHWRLEYLRFGTNKKIIMKLLHCLYNKYSGYQQNWSHKWKASNIPLVRNPIIYLENVPEPFLSLLREEGIQTSIASQVNTDYEYCETSNPITVPRNELSDLTRDSDHLKKEKNINILLKKMKSYRTKKRD